MAYEICGTCSIQCFNGTTHKIRLFPSEGYLSPSKDKALFISNVDETAFLKSFVLNEKFVEIDMPPLPSELIQTVLSATTTQRKIKLSVENGASLQLVGCLFPAP